MRTPLVLVRPVLLLPGQLPPRLSSPSRPGQQLSALRVLLPIKSPNLALKKYNKKKDLLLSTRVPYYRELKILATPADDKLVIFGVANIQPPNNNNNNNTVHWGEESKSKKK
jgi:hypothetical protein